MSSKSLYILWDESNIWGLLAWRAAIGYGLPYRIVQAAEIADGLLQKYPPAVLLVPGGVARLKAERLGANGLEAIRAYVKSGGHYLGFCGGCGLGLSSDEGDVPSLGLCPWQRGHFDDRMQHFMSGHLQGALEHQEHGFAPENSGTDSTGTLLPVWWPSRFSTAADTTDNVNVTVLARYDGKPGPDFWLADLPIADLPLDAFSNWQAMYGLNLSPAFLQGQPCTIYGSYGQGDYLLSYSHLETPSSPFANSWLAHILRRFGCEPSQDVVPAWKMEAEPQVWFDERLSHCLTLIQGVMDTGVKHGLLFRRNDWLYGWRTGMPGVALNNLHAALHTALSLPHTHPSVLYWEEKAAELVPQMEVFAEGVTGYLLAERLAMTLVKNMPDAVSQKLLKSQRQNLFGPPKHAGGLYEGLITVFDELARLQISHS